METTKALIAVAGYGTRRFPVASTVEKSMMPVGNMPVVHYAVRQCVEAGITDITFIVSKQSDQLRQLYTEPDNELAAYLREHGKVDKLKELQDIARMATVSFLTQEKEHGYGTAVPLWLGRSALENGKVLYLFGDQFLHNTDGNNEVVRYLGAADTAGTPSAMLALPVAREEAHKYGIVSTTERDGMTLYQGILEKPPLDQTPDKPLNNGSYWLLGSDFLPYLEQYMSGELPRTSQTEFMVTDVANAYTAAGNDMLVYTSEAELLDCGTREGNLHTNLVIGRYEGWWKD